MRIMTLGSDIGFVASGLVLAAFGMKDMINLRIVAICSNFAFIAYALLLSLPPVLILHVILLPLNGWRLMEALKQRSAMAGQSYVPLRPVADVAAASLDLS
jgi:CRP/FNR family cyclic AMP-dependent transcriptional regulator